MGEKALGILSEEKRLANPRIRSTDVGTPTTPYPPISDSVPGSPSIPFLEQRSNPDGLVQLLPRNYDVRNRAMGSDHEDATGSSAVAITESPLAADEEIARVEVLKISGRISSQPHHIDLPASTFSDMRSGGPQTPGSASVLSNASRSTPMEITPGLHVLVVDDDRMTRLLMTRMLERLRCVVTTAANGKQALQLLLGEEQSVSTPGEEQEANFSAEDRDVPRDGGSMQTFNKEGRFVITFLDNQMPTMSGVEMVRKLRMLGREDLIVGVTGNALLSDQEEYLGAGADQYVHLAVRHSLSGPHPSTFASILTKPVREENLRSMLSIADERRRSRARDSYQSPLQLQLPPPMDSDGLTPTPA